MPPEGWIRKKLDVEDDGSNHWAYRVVHFSLNIMLRISLFPGRGRACRHCCISFCDPTWETATVFQQKKTFRQYLENISKQKFDIQYLKNLSNISFSEIWEQSSFWWCLNGISLHTKRTCKNKSKNTIFLKNDQKLTSTHFSKIINTFEWSPSLICNAQNRTTYIFRISIFLQNINNQKTHFSKNIHSNESMLCVTCVVLFI